MTLVSMLLMGLVFWSCVACRLWVTAAVVLGMLHVTIGVVFFAAGLKKSDTNNREDDA